MDNITIIEGDDLALLLALLGVKKPVVWRVRVWQEPDGSGAKFAVDGGMWTPALGERDER